MEEGAINNHIKMKTNNGGGEGEHRHTHAQGAVSDAWDAAAFSQCQEFL